MGKYTKGYIELKIKQCNHLVNGATSENQKEIYQDYLDFWTNKLESIDSNNWIEPKKDEGIIKSTLLDGELRKAIAGEDDDWEVKEATNFRIKFPNKKAYYKRDGTVHKTKAFIEFLNLKE